MLSEISQIEKGKHCMVSFIGGIIKKKQNNKPWVGRNSRRVVAGRWGK